MNDSRRRTFDAGDGGAEVEQPLLRAVLSYAPISGPTPHPSVWLDLPAENGTGALRLRLSCAGDLGDGVEGPFGSRFYIKNGFEVIVPQRKPGQGALLMIQLTGVDAPRRYEFDTQIPHGWSLRLEADGSVTALDHAHRAAIYVGAPWAFDANLNRVRVTYTLENGKLVQNIDVDAHTAFPVLVDPDPDAILTGDGRLITEKWAPRLVATADDIVMPDDASRRRRRRS